MWMWWQGVVSFGKLDPFHNFGGSAVLYCFDHTYLMDLMDSYVIFEHENLF
jgi:hypothetical protein